MYYVCRQIVLVSNLYIYYYCRVRCSSHSEPLWLAAWEPCEDPLNVAELTKMLGRKEGRKEERRDKKKGMKKGEKGEKRENVDIREFTLPTLPALSTLTY
jgi:hypothetical protein